jgi:dTDP-4-dehydrorhamnose 3,5-epimerase
MFVDGSIDGVVLRDLGTFCDDRGWLAELFRNDELPAEHAPVMAYISETGPGVARGPHAHEDQSDYFAFIGPGDFKLYLWDNRADGPTFRHRHVEIVGASRRRSVIIPPGVVHAYRNVSAVPGWVFNAPNRLYAGEGKQGPVDEVRWEDVADSPFVLD